jgi:hypothetical protein
MMRKNPWSGNLETQMIVPRPCQKWPAQKTNPLMEFPILKEIRDTQTVGVAWTRRILTIMMRILITMGTMQLIINTFTCLAATSIHIPAAFSMVTNDNVIDPALLEMGNCIPTVSDYQLPCATIDQALVTMPEEMCLAEKKSTSNKGHLITKAQGLKHSGMQK